MINAHRIGDATVTGTLYVPVLGVFSALLLGGPLGPRRVAARTATR